MLAHPWYGLVSDITEYQYFDSLCSGWYSVLKMWMVINCPSISTFPTSIGWSVLFRRTSCGLSWMLIVADGAPGLIKAVEQCWPASDRQHCAVHRVRNLLAKLPERERKRVRAAYWQALDEAINERDGRQRLKALVEELDKSGYTAAAKCLDDDLDALVVHLRYPTATAGAGGQRTCSSARSAR
jgi:hypothetical protein